LDRWVGLVGYWHGAAGLFELVQDEGDDGSGSGVLEPVSQSGIAFASEDAPQNSGERDPVRVGSEGLQQGLQGVAGVDIAFGGCGRGFG